TAVFNPLNNAVLPLMNPFAKLGIEMGMNQSLDPDFDHPIRGGEYNAMNKINEWEAGIIHAGRILNPITGLLAKLSKNGDLPGPMNAGLNMGDGSYKDELGYSGLRDVVSGITGVGMYQALNEKPKQEEAPTPEYPAVGPLQG